ncbi:MAG: hypothetical protein HOB20_14785, partial [Planctomycetaceae bacterium]|nr:hypothetical protein [Planctomycetaceae bacterium]
QQDYVEHGLIAIPLGSKGRVSETEIRRIETPGIPEVPSPIHDDGYIYMVKNGGITDLC